MTSHEKRVSALIRLHGMSKTAAIKRAKELEKMPKKVKPRARKNPASINVDIDLGSHNAKGARAGTRTNPKPRKNPLKPGITARPVKGKRKPIFAVEYSNSDKGPWATAGIFPNRQLAADYAKSMHAVNEARWWRVVLK